MNRDFKTYIFDLDDTLLDTSSLLIPIANSPEFLIRISQPLPLMPGALANLVGLKQNPKNKQLVLATWGRKTLQDKKIQSLGLPSLFDSIFVISSEEWPDKMTGFQKWVLPEVEKTALPQNTLAIGNRIRTDLRPAKIWGAWTCHFAYGEHQDELKENSFDEPDFVVKDHAELKRVLF